MIYHLFISVLFAIGIPNLAIHDVALALYELKIEDKEVTLSIHIDKYDLEESIVNKNRDMDIPNFILSQSSWTLNDQPLDFKLASLSEEVSHYEIVFSSKRNAMPLQSLVIENKVLIDIANHSNIIQLHYNDEFRSFRMHKDRTTTEIEF